jgi:hypothetical protein
MKKLEKKSLQKAGQKLFLQEAFDEGLVMEGECVEVTEVRDIKSRSGVIVETDQFIVLVYKSSEWYGTLVDTLVELTEANPSYALMLTVCSNEPDGFDLYIDEDVVRIWHPTKKFGGLTVYKSDNGSRHGAEGTSRRVRRGRGGTP